MADRYCDSASLIETKQSEVNIKRNRRGCVIYRSQIPLFLGSAVIIVKELSCHPATENYK